MGLEPLTGERQGKETNKAIMACNDYLRMGPGRSLQKLHRKYIEYTLENPPTKHLRVLARWSTNFGWQSRATLYDSEVEEHKTQEAKKRQKQALETGLSLDYERIITLKELSAFLLGQLYEEGETGTLHRLWLPDVKQIGSGEFAQRVDIERFNAPLISEIRGLLDDLAKETGGRMRRVEINWRDKLPPDRKPDEVLQQFAELLALAAKRDELND